MIAAALLCGALVGAAALAIWLSGAPPHDRSGPDAWAWTGANSEHEGAQVFESCASCHLPGGEGRSDGSVPRLAGQKPEILAAKLRRIASGTTYLPVMTAFARALSNDEMEAVAGFLASLPAPEAVGQGPGEELTRGAEVYATRCMACHGVGALGTALAPRLCGQHYGYTRRRITEVLENSRGDGDPVMAAMVASLPGGERSAVADYLSREPCGVLVADVPGAGQPGSPGTPSPPPKAEP